MTVQAARPATLQAQARQLRSEFPELFAYLSERDQKLQRAFRRVPSPADIELSATWNHRSFVQKTFDSIGAGVGRLVEQDW
jgi:hypothetical protein